MTKKRNKVNVKKIYKFWNDTFGIVPEPAKILGTHAPEVLDAYNRMRQYYLRKPPEGALPVKVKELIYVALDVVLGAPVKLMKGHVRAAIKAGATKEEFVEVVTLTIMLGGMPKYMSTGYEVIKTAARLERKST